jgi:hypothetical protein
MLPPVPDKMSSLKKLYPNRAPTAYFPVSAIALTVNGANTSETINTDLPRPKPVRFLF